MGDKQDRKAGEKRGRLLFRSLRREKWKIKEEGTKEPIRWQSKTTMEN